METPKGRILVVDDDPHAVEILTRMLEREGYDCVSAMRGHEALEILATEAIDVILLDVMMPEMDGLQVCEHLRSDPELSQIPVLLLTARDDMETRARSMMLGVSEFLSKPINKRELFSRVAAQIHTLEIGRKLSAASTADDGSDGE